MFIGYQNGNIAFVAETREELENLSCVELDKIEEVSEEYVLKDGLYMLKAEADTIQAKENKQARINELKQQLAYSDYVVLKIAEGSATAEEYADVLAARRRWRAEINALESPAKDSNSTVVELYSMEI